MRHVSSVTAAGTIVVATLLISPLHSAEVGNTRLEIARAIEGKICTTKAGATFVFGRDGNYAYEGLWKSDGHYRISQGLIDVTFHSGLERSFSITIRSGIPYMEETALSCSDGSPKTAHAR